MIELNYKGYQGSSEFDQDEGVYFGKVLGIEDLVSYEARTLDILSNSFEEAVDDYLELCNKINKVPNKTKTNAN